MYTERIFLFSSVQWMHFYFQFYILNDIYFIRAFGKGLAARGGGGGEGKNLIFIN